MKTILVFATGMICLCFIFAFSGKVKQSQSQSEFVMITYTAYATNNKATITIHYGGSKFEEIQLTKDQISNTVANNVIDLLNKFSSLGYSLVSTTPVGVNQINCFLKKTDK